MRSPIQLVVRSRTKSRAFTTLNIPGRGSGKNVCYIEEERSTEYINKAKENGLISTKIVNKTENVSKKTKEGE
jgi:hypothetical protein